MFYVAIIMVIKSLAGLIALKVQATMLLPNSFAVLSQFMTFAGLVTNISSAAVTSGMTVLLARSETKALAGQLIQSGKAFSTGVSSIISFLCVLLFFYSTDFISINPLPQYLFLILSVSPWLITRSSIAQARLTSAYQLDQFAKISNASAIAVAMLIIVLTFYFGLTGGAIATATGPMIAACILLLFAPNKVAFSDTTHTVDNRGNHIAELLRFSTAMIVAICAVPIAHILVRESMIHAGSIDQAGYWSSTVRLSDVYMQFFGLLLTTYILPKISSQEALFNSKHLFISYLFRLVFIGIVVLGTVFIFREYIVLLVLAPEFAPAANLLKTQLVGDIFRITLSFFFWFSYGQNLKVFAAAEEVLQAALFFLFFKLIYYGNNAQDAVSAHMLASVTNTIIIGGGLWFVLSKRPRN
jgi:O-antigen/teichoic acid export membrane protein